MSLLNRLFKNEKEKIKPDEPVLIVDLLKMIDDRHKYSLSVFRVGDSYSEVGLTVYYDNDAYYRSMPINQDKLLELMRKEVFEKEE